MARTSKDKEEKQEPIKEVAIQMKDVTDRFINMLEAFESDFILAREHERSLIDLQVLIQKGDERLITDINKLETLMYGLRHGTIKIYEKEV